MLRLDLRITPLRENLTRNYKSISGSKQRISAISKNRPASMLIVIKIDIVKKLVKAIQADVSSGRETEIAPTLQNCNFVNCRVL